jgi:hypothetical protein
MLLLASLVSLKFVEESVFDSSTVELPVELSDGPPDEVAVLPEDDEADPVVELPVVELSKLLVAVLEPENRFPAWF